MTINDEGAGRNLGVCSCGSPLSSPGETEAGACRGGGDRGAREAPVLFPPLKVQEPETLPGASRGWPGLGCSAGWFWLGRQLGVDRENLSSLPTEWGPCVQHPQGAPHRHSPWSWQIRFLWPLWQMITGGVASNNESLFSQPVSQKTKLRVSTGPHSLQVR